MHHPRIYCEDYLPRFLVIIPPSNTSSLMPSVILWEANLHLQSGLSQI